MLTQGPTPDRKCKLNVSSLVERWCQWGTSGTNYLMVYFFTCAFVFCSLMSSVSFF